MGIERVSGLAPKTIGPYLQPNQLSGEVPRTITITPSDLDREILSFRPPALPHPTAEGLQLRRRRP
jgi:hypothetical protein